MSEHLEATEERLLQHGDFVTVKLTGWLGQIVDFKQEGYNDPSYLVRIWTGSVLLREWFSACELDLIIDDEPSCGCGLEADNVIDFTAFKGKLNKDTPTGGAA